MPSFSQCKATRKPLTGRLGQPLPAWPCALSVSISPAEPPQSLRAARTPRPRRPPTERLFLIPPAGPPALSFSLLPVLVLLVKVLIGVVDLLVGHGGRQHRLEQRHKQRPLAPPSRAPHALTAPSAPRAVWIQGLASHWLSPGPANRVPRRRAPPEPSAAWLVRSPLPTNQRQPRRAGERYVTVGGGGRNGGAGRRRARRRRARAVQAHGGGAGGKEAASTRAGVVRPGAQRHRLSLAGPGQLPGNPLLSGQWGRRLRPFNKASCLH